MLAQIPALEDYVREHTLPEPPVLARLRQVTRETMVAPQMQVGPVEGAFLHLLVHLTRARRVLEVGTFTGYSAIAMARALPEDGTLVTCDIDPKAHDIARAHLAEAGLATRVDLRLGPAIDTLDALLAEGARFDLVFLDADKENYCAYLERALAMLPPGGLLVADNTLWSGHVLRPRTDAARGIVAFNQAVAAHPDLEAVVLTVRDGMTLARKVR